eukprot:TRINITY_DN15085_c0_g1_i1.p2 TRINITY_DN15085_c0_g1~~TRINITY_DN15085_c0_g1_i1.p2  ORF type:complete len:174 (+),score=16.86 TRINITY_DN15085_c0_g1_i1:135-656(+)
MGCAASSGADRHIANYEITTADPMRFYPRKLRGIRMKYEQKTLQEDTDDFDIVMHCLELTRVDFNERLVCACTAVISRQHGDNVDLWDEMVQAIAQFEHETEEVKIHYVFKRIITHGLVIETENPKAHLTTEMITRRMLLKFTNPMPNVCNQAKSYLIRTPPWVRWEDDNPFR